MITYSYTYVQIMIMLTISINIASFSWIQFIFCYVLFQELKNAASIHSRYKMLSMHCKNDANWIQERIWIDIEQKLVLMFGFWMFLFLLNDFLKMHAFNIILSIIEMTNMIVIILDYKPRMYYKSNKPFIYILFYLIFYYIIRFYL